MSGSNKGSFEPCFLPVGVDEVDAPHGVERVCASIAAHLDDLPRLHIDEEDSLTIRDSFVADAARFATNCGQRGADWEDVEPMIDGACALAGVQLTADERRELLETWIAAAPVDAKAA